MTNPVTRWLCCTFFWLGRNSLNCYEQKVEKLFGISFATWSACRAPVSTRVGFNHMLGHHRNSNAHHGGNGWCIVSSHFKIRPMFASLGDASDDRIRHVARNQTIIFSFLRLGRPLIFQISNGWSAVDVQIKTPKGQSSSSKRNAKRARERETEREYSTCYAYSAQPYSTWLFETICWATWTDPTSARKPSKHRSDAVCVPPDCPPGSRFRKSLVVLPTLSPATSLLFSTGLTKRGTV